MSDTRPVRVWFDLAPLLLPADPQRDAFAALFARLAAACPGALGGLLSGDRAAPPAMGGTPDALVYAQTRRVIALDADPGTRMAATLGERLAERVLPGAVRALLARRGLAGTEDLTGNPAGLIDPALFGDWLWMRLFAARLPPELRPAVLACRYAMPQASRPQALGRARAGRPIRLRTEARHVVTLADPVAEVFPWAVGPGQLVVRGTMTDSATGTMTGAATGPADAIAVPEARIASLPPQWQTRGTPSEAYVQALLRGGAIAAHTRFGLAMPPGLDRPLAEAPFALATLWDGPALDTLLAAPRTGRLVVLLETAPPEALHAALHAAVESGAVIPLAEIDLDDRKVLHDASLTAAPEVDATPILAAWRAVLGL